jgi:hypothetical protein
MRLRMTAPIVAQTGTGPMPTKVAAKMDRRGGETDGGEELMMLCLAALGTARRPSRVSAST